MPQARGSQSSYTMGDETAYGQDPGSPAANRIYLLSCGLDAPQSLLQSQTLTSARTQAKPDRGNKNPGGPLVAELHSESVCKLLKHAFGALNSTGTDPYVHTFTIGDLPAGFFFEKNFGANISGNNIEKYNGCRVGSMELNIPQEGYPSLTFNVVGANMTPASALLDATPYDHGVTPFTSASLSTIEEGGSTIGTVRTLKFTLSNDLDEDGFVLGNGGLRAALVEGFAPVTVEAEALFDSVALRDKALNNTATSLRTVFTRGDGLGSSGNESFEMFAETIVYEPFGVPIEGPKGVIQKLKGTGYDATALKCIVKNAISGAEI